MSHDNNIGKLIISKYNDFYETFHNLELVLVRGNRNRIEIDHKIQKLVISGNNNKVIISNSGKVRQIKFRGNNNIIEANTSNSLNRATDYGNNNEIFIRRRRFTPEFDDSYNDEDNDDDDDDDNEEDESDEEYNDRYHINDEILEEIRRSIFNGGLNHENDLDSENNNYNLIDITYKKDAKEVKEEDEKCVICYENFKKEEALKMTNCFHTFHCKCIKKWIKSKLNIKETPDCPICRREL